MIINAQNTRNFRSFFYFSGCFSVLQKSKNLKIYQNPEFDSRATAAAAFFEVLNCDKKQRFRFTNRFMNLKPSDEYDVTTLLDAKSYDFKLPKELIAQEPSENREDARLMVVNPKLAEITHSHIRELDVALRSGDCIVLNDTKVVPAQLVGKRVRTGGRWQGLVVEDDGRHWKMLAKTRGKIQIGERVELIDRQGKARFEIELISKTDDNFWIGTPLGDQSNDEQLHSASHAELISLVGRIPLPHYIRGGNMVDADVQNYQTVFARNAGAIAAPTAGLHFTQSLLQRLIDKGVKIATVTLHVGIGTFRPLATENLNDHQMHAEFGSLSESSANTINQCRDAGGRIIAIGTTSVRVLESAATAEQPLAAWSGETDLFIKPGYQFKTIDGLLTNFHLPRSTLIVLVRTFGGHSLIKQAYRMAVDEEYRFFSYGDAMLIV